MPSPTKNSTVVEKPAPEPRPGGTSALAVGLGAALAIASALAGAVLAGAVLLHLGGAALAERPGAAFGVAVGVAALGSIGLPVLLNRWLTSAHRRRDPGARSMVLSTIGWWNAVALVGLLGLAPRTSRAALEAHGDWPLRRAHAPAAEALGRGARWVAARIPRSAPAPAEPAPVAAEGGGAAGATSAAAGATSAAEADGAAAGTATAAASAAPASTFGVTPASIPTDRDLAPEEIFQLRADTVVVIAARSRPDPTSPIAKVLGILAPVGLGSGFLVGEEGLIVTNEHVIHDAESVRVKLRDGRMFTEVELLVVDRARDLALIKIDAPRMPVAPIAPDDAVRIGGRAVAIGSPRGLEYSLTDGIVSATRDMQGTKFLQIQTTIAPGSSGGPLFDPRGRVLGVVTGTQGAGLNLALHPRYVRDLLEKPRAPKKLAPFADDARVTSLVLEGAEASPLERANIEEVAKLMAMSAEGCLSGAAPDAPAITVRYEPAGGEDEGIVSLAKPKVTSNLGPKGDKCLQMSTQLSGFMIARLLAEEHDAELDAGNTITLKLGIELPPAKEVPAGADAGAPDVDAGGADAGSAQGGKARSLEVRFEIAPPKKAAPKPGASAQAP